MILTGTPLHNNLAELWSLLNFILPDIFDDLESFQQWFNFDDVHSSAGDGLLNKGAIVQQLHEILKPFLLRRLKTEVEKELPPKKEYLLYAPLTQPQKDIYQAIVNGEIREYLIRKLVGGDDPIPEEPEIEFIEEKADQPNGVRSRRSLGMATKTSEKSSVDAGRAWRVSQAREFRSAED